jgi:2-dehydropantoate 2-reductase
VKTVCSLQNTIVKERELTEWIGDASKVMGASAIEGGALDAPGKVSNHVTVPTTAWFGELDGTVSPRAQAIADAFTKAGLGAKAVPYIQQVLWEKLAQICNASAWSVSTLAGNPELTFVHGMSIREGAEHYVALSRELLAVYTAMGYQPQNFYAPLSRLKDVHDCKTDEEAVQLILGFGQRMTKQGYVGRTSMHEDVIRGKKTEVDWIVKPFVEKGAELGIPVPTVAAAYRIIKVLDHYLA